MEFAPLVEAINFRGVVSGLTHDFYRYPARFSPMFARASIEAFTKPGDTILDPFAGGGTTMVEALVSGRHAIGVDVSQLAVFLTRVKTTLVTKHDVDAIAEWAVDAVRILSPLKTVERHSEWRTAGYQTNLPWRFRKVAEQALNAAQILPERLRAIARCIVLKTLQWAVDCKKHLPSSGEFRKRMVVNAISITKGLEALRHQVSALRAAPSIEVLHGSAGTISALGSQLLRERPPKLVVTSPPYPAVHVLYHRWQVQGRKETAAPFWIADCLDGEGGAFYTFGDRRNQRHEEIYFRELLTAFTEIRKVVRKDAFVVQLVGFGNPEEHLPTFLRTMRQAGFVEYERTRYRRRHFWRLVPNRKWYTSLRSETKQTSEILLVHRPAH